MECRRGLIGQLFWQIIKIKDILLLVELNKIFEQNIAIIFQIFHANHTSMCLDPHNNFKFTPSIPEACCDKRCNAIYTASKVKHHPNIISEMVFIYRFLQKNN